LPAITASAFQVTLSGRLSPALCASTASCDATAAGPQPSRLAGGVEEREADVVGDPAGLAPERAEAETSQPRGERQRKERQTAEGGVPGHPPAALALREAP